MRIAHLLTVPVLATLVAAPTRVSAQRVTVTFGAQLGPEIGVFAYSPERMGDWHNNQQWQLVTLYDVNGRYYRNPVRGARPLLVYYYRNEYFFPPRDQGWNDRRYNNGRRPNDGDYRRARAYDRGGIVVDARFGNEIGVLAYSRERAGDWHRNYRKWTPITLYEFNGRYYPNSGPGGRPVSMYRYKNEYFLPPTDQDWVNADRRYDYGHQPDHNDRGRMRDHP